MVGPWLPVGPDPLVAVTQQIDLSGPVGRMVASVLFGLAEIEMEYRRERQAAGIAEAKKRDVYRGRDQGTGTSYHSRRTAFRYLATASAS